MAGSNAGDYGSDTNTTDVLIIGAGLSGMTAAIDMIRKDNGRNFIIIEKGNQIGGTWNDQRYPGCCCDVWSHLYSLSFEPNPNWTRLYPAQPEILSYLFKIASKYRLFEHIRFSSSVSEARWDPTTSKWVTQIQRLGAKDAEYGESYTITSSFLISAVGQLNYPKYPDIKGLDTFQGKIMHSARWDWSYDIRDKKIGVIGNGASAVQIVPEIAPVSKELVLFQRTPNWVLPRQDQPISPFFRAVFKYVPFVRSRLRAVMMDMRESHFYDGIFNPESGMSKEFVAASKMQLETQLPGEERAGLREKLQPHYAVGCKRVLVSDDFFPTFLLPNTHLETSPIREITPTGITTSNGEETTHREFDLLVLATGFKATQFMYPIKIYGSSGTSLEEIWAKEGASAYLGMTIPSLPNFAMMYGPNTNLGHNSIILMIEAQSLYINTLIRKILTSQTKGKSLSLEPKEEVVKQWNKEMQARLAKSSFADEGCGSWYKDEKGRITNNWMGTVVEYQKATDHINWDEWVVKGSGAEAVRKEGKVRWGRVVEETRISNLVIGLGTVAAVGAVLGGWLWRGALRVR